MDLQVGRCLRFRTAAVFLTARINRRIVLQMPTRKDATGMPPVLLEDLVDQKVAVSVEQVENISNSEVTAVDSDLLLPSRRVLAERRLVRVLDLRLLPTIILIFVLNYIDVGLFGLWCMCSLSLEFRSDWRSRLPV